MGGVRQGRACAGEKWKAGSYAGSPVVHCGGADSRVRRNAADLNRPLLKWYAPIASVAALTAQPLAALPPYGCGVPFTGVERLVQENSTAGGHWCTTAPPDVSLRGAKRRGNLAVLGRITGRSRRKRSCLPEIATAPLGPRNDKSEGIAPLNLCRDHCQPARRSLTAATDAIGFYHFIDSLYESQALCRERHAAPLQRAADARIIQQKQGRTGLGASLFFQLLIPPPAWACRGAYTWSSSRRGGCSHSRCSGTGGRRAACAARRPCTPGRSQAARRPS